MKKPLLLMIVCFLFGVFMADIFPAERFTGRYDTVYFLLFLSFFLSLLFIGKKALFYVLLSFFFLFLGVSRYTSSVIPLYNDISKYVSCVPQEMTVQGMVSGEAEWKQNKYGRHAVFPIRASRFLSDETEKKTWGKILVSVMDPEYIPLIGDEIAITGKISLPKGKTNPSGYDHGKHLKYEGIYSTMFSPSIRQNAVTGLYHGPFLSTKRGLSKIRRHAEKILDRYIGKDTAALVKSALLGIRSDVTERVKEALTKTGTMHILAVSGLHIGILVFIFISILSFFIPSKKTVYLSAIVMIFAFVVIAGGRPSSLRAAIMGAFIMLSALSGRRSDIMNALGFSAFLIVFFDPGQLFGAGFILSYIAVLSIVYITPFTDAVICRVLGREKLSFPNKIVTYMMKLFSVSIAIWIGMMPIAAYYFRIIPFTTALVNLAAIPFLFIVIVLGLLIICMGSMSIFYPVTRLISLGLDSAVRSFIKFTEVVERIPISFVKVGAPSFWIIFIAYAAIAAILYFKNKEKRAIRLFMLLLFLSNIFVWDELMKGPPKDLSVTFFDSGKSDTIFFEFPDGGSALIDCGKGAGKNIIEPYLRDRGVRKIDCVFITHFHEDHCGGVPYILKNFNIGAIVTGDLVNRQNIYFDNLCKIMKEKKVKEIKVSRGDSISGSEDLRFIILNPCRNRAYDKENESSLVMKGVYKNENSILFCGDIENRTIEELSQFDGALKSDIVKVPHHGTLPARDTELYRDFYRMTQCEEIVVTNKNIEGFKRKISKISGKEEENVHITGEDGAVIAVKQEGKAVIMSDFVKVQKS
ncbi:MAG: DNA internalization-related competence protein ComEC/Rec2 [Candidatus Omnitrophota bacterium]